jgi:hypothetical protein
MKNNDKGFWNKEEERNRLYHEKHCKSNEKREESRKRVPPTTCFTWMKCYFSIRDKMTFAILVLIQ